MFMFNEDLIPSTIARTSDVEEIFTKVEEIDSKFVYSTEEQFIGTWFGKKLYRKMYRTSITSGGNHDIANISSLNPELCWINLSHSFLKTSQSSPEFKCLNFIENDASYYIKGLITDNTTVRVFNSSSPYYYGTLYLEINYTKTTD